MNIEEPKIQNYKIKVANEAESKEVQELFFALGYAWLNNEKEYFTLLEDHFIVTFSDGVILQAPLNHYNTTHEEHQEITLPQLRDLVVLHRNDVGDATHTNKNNDGEFLFKSSDNKLYYFNTILNQWQAMWGAEPDNAINECAMPIAKQKEQLQMTWQDALRAVLEGKEVEIFRDGKWQSINEKFKDEGYRLTPQRKELNGNFTKEELLKIAGEMG